MLINKINEDMTGQKTIHYPLPLISAIDSISSLYSVNQNNIKVCSGFSKKGQYVLKLFFGKDAYRP